MRPVHPSRVLVLMACGGDKLDRPARLLDLYTGPMWSTLRAHIGAIPASNVYVLSAKLGLASALETAAPYDCRMTAEKADRFIALGLSPIDRNRDFHRGLDRWLHANHEAALDPRGAPWEAVIVGAAGHYARALLWLVEALRARGLVAAGAPVLTVSGGIGEQRGELGRHLRAVNQIDGTILLQTAPLTTEETDDNDELGTAIGTRGAYSVASETVAGDRSGSEDGAAMGPRRDTDPVPGLQARSVDGHGSSEPGTRRAYLTPGTWLAWSTLAEWIDAARTIDRRKCCKRTHDQAKAHWRELPLELVETASAEDLEAFVDFISRCGPPSEPWCKPGRGGRRGTLWEERNVRARNRLFRLRRAAELDDIPHGANYIAASVRRRAEAAPANVWDHVGEPETEVPVSLLEVA